MKSLFKRLWQRPNKKPILRRKGSETILEAKTLKELLEENDRKSGFFVNTPTNGTPRYKILGFSTSKNLAILMHRGTGMRCYRKYYDLFVLNNSRWFRI